MEHSSKEETDLEKRIEHFRKALEKNEVLTTFDRLVFESVVDKVIIGGEDRGGECKPYKLTFVYKTGFYNAVQSKMHKQLKKREGKIM